MMIESPLMEIISGNTYEESNLSGFWILIESRVVAVMNQDFFTGGSKVIPMITIYDNYYDVIRIIYLYILVFLESCSNLLLIFGIMFIITSLVMRHPEKSSLKVSEKHKEAKIKSKDVEWILNLDTKSNPISNKPVPREIPFKAPQKKVDGENLETMISITDSEKKEQIRCPRCKKMQTVGSLCIYCGYELGQFENKTSSSIGFDSMNFMPESSNENPESLNIVPDSSTAIESPSVPENIFRSFEEEQQKVAEKKEVDIDDILKKIVITVDDVRKEYTFEDPPEVQEITLIALENHVKLPEECCCPHCGTKVKTFTKPCPGCNKPVVYNRAKYRVNQEAQLKLVKKVLYKIHKKELQKLLNDSKKVPWWLSDFYQKQYFWRIARKRTKDARRKAFEEQYEKIQQEKIDQRLEASGFSNPQYCDKCNTIFNKSMDSECPLCMKRKKLTKVAYVLFPIAVILAIIFPDYEILTMKISPFIFMAIVSVILSIQYLHQSKEIHLKELFDANFSINALKYEVKKEVPAKRILKIISWVHTRITALLGLLSFFRSFILGTILIILVFVILLEVCYRSGTYFEREWILKNMEAIQQSAHQVEKIDEDIEKFEKKGKVGKFFAKVVKKDKSSLEKKKTKEEDYQDHLESSITADSQMVKDAAASLSQVKKDLKPKFLMQYLGLNFIFFNIFGTLVFYASFLLTIITGSGDFFTKLIEFYSIPSWGDDIIIGAILVFTFAITYQASPHITGPKLRKWFYVVSIAFFFWFAKNPQIGENKLKERAQKLQSMGLSIPQIITADDTSPREKKLIKMMKLIVIGLLLFILIAPALSVILQYVSTDASSDLLTAFIVIYAVFFLSLSLFVFGGAFQRFSFSHEKAESFMNKGHQGAFEKTMNEDIVNAFYKDFFIAGFVNLIIVFVGFVVLLMNPLYGLIAIFVQLAWLKIFCLATLKHEENVSKKKTTSEKAKFVFKKLLRS